SPAACWVPSRRKCSRSKRSCARTSPTDEEIKARWEAALARRRERAALKAKLHSATVNHHLGDDQRQCPSCGGIADRPLGTGKQTYLYEYVPGYFVRRCHVQEKAACACGAFIATADPAVRPIEGGHYGAGFLAHIAVTQVRRLDPAASAREAVRAPRHPDVAFDADRPVPCDGREA